MMELFGAAATEGLKGLITEVIKSTSLKLLERGDRPLGDDELAKQLQRACQEYKKRYADRHGTVQIFCVRMRDPMQLSEIYTNVRLLDRADLPYYESLEGLQELFRRSGRRGFGRTTAKTLPGIEVANREARLMVLGSPGIGKSTYLRKVGLEAFNALEWPDDRAPYQPKCIPVFVRLQELDSETKTVQAAIAQELEVGGFSKAQELMIEALEMGKLLLLLDGLDEVPAQQRSRVIREIRDLSDRYPKNRFITSCRLAAYKGGFERFKNAVMAPFEDDQMEQFVGRWFRANGTNSEERERHKAKGEACWQLLNDKAYAAAKELGQTPLLLALLCVIYDRDQDFPRKRASLYLRALDVLLKEWKQEESIKRDPIYRDLSLELEEALLAKMAYDSFVADQLFFESRWAKSQIREFLKTHLNAPQSLDAERVLTAIEVQQGILTQRAQNAYSFSHLTLQEYLTAKFADDNDKAETLVNEHLTDKRWREVFLLLAEMMPDPQGVDNLLRWMERRAQAYLQSERVRALLGWAVDATNDEHTDYTRVIRRVIAIFLVCDIARDIALSRDSRDLRYSFDTALTRARTLAQTLNNGANCNLIKDLVLNRIYLGEKIFKVGFVPSATELEDAIKECFSSISAQNKIFLKSWKLPPTLVDLSKEEAQSLVDYLYACELMVQCKNNNTAVRVSPEVWAAIESRMVTPTPVP